MKTIVHVNQHKIKANRKTGATNPVLTCKTYKSSLQTNTAILVDDNGVELGRFVYRPDKPLSCGAHVWFETQLKIITGDE